MNENFESQDQQITQTIALTNRLEKSLRNLLHKKKTVQTQFYTEDQNNNQAIIGQLMNKINRLQAQKKILSMDNHKLSAELIKMREELQQVKKKIMSMEKDLSSSKSYIASLQRQLMFWMKNREETQNQDSISSMIRKIINLRQTNQRKQSQLQSLKCYSPVSQLNSRKSRRNTEDNCLQKFQNEAICLKIKKQSQSRIKKMSQSSICDYHSKQKQKSHKKSNSQIKKDKEKDNTIHNSLRKWHRSYLNKH